jgi:uncharacterized protein YaaN involved in tellurite resistance
MMFGASKELDDLRNRMAIAEREAQQLREIVAELYKKDDLTNHRVSGLLEVINGLLSRVQELELKGQRPKSHFTKP